MPAIASTAHASPGRGLQYRTKTAATTCTGGHPPGAARLPHLGAHGGCCTVGNCEALNDGGRQLVVREQLAPVVGRVGSMVTHAPAPPAALPSKAVLRRPAWKGWPRIDMRRRGHRFSVVAGRCS